ncbi:MAG: 3-phosphoshikimate 1-carboxyvinyltransferase [Acidimicrobiales bacterium]
MSRNGGRRPSHELPGDQEVPGDQELPGSHELTGSHELMVDPGSPLNGTIRVPGDKSISHRALLLASRSQGRSTLRGLSNGMDVTRTALGLAAMGAEISRSVDRVSAAGLPITGLGGRRDIETGGNIDPEMGWDASIEGGLERLHEPGDVIDLGNSGTGIRLMAGFAAGFDWLSVLTGDESVRSRPMDRVVEPLRLMGAGVDGRDNARLAPLSVRGGHLTGIDYTPPVASAQVKSAVLLAGLGAEGDTIVREPILTRTHTEDLLSLAGADLDVSVGVKGARAVRIRASELSPLDLDIPGDPSQAAFWIVAACIVPGSRIKVERVYWGPGRVGFVAVLERMGADLDLCHHGDGTVDISAGHSALRATDIEAGEVADLVDEVPILAVAAAVARGDSVFSGLGELRVKESDRVSGTVAVLGALGARAEVAGDGFVVSGSGGAPLAGGRVESNGDHRLAMAGAVAALAAAGPSVILGWEAVATSYPGFDRHRARLSQS